MPFNLTPKQRKELRNALVDAFPRLSSLAQILYFEFDKNLEEITKDSNLSDVVFDLIRTADAQGWLIDLIRAAISNNPGNQLLKAIAQELLPSDDPAVSSHSRQYKSNNQQQFDVFLAHNSQEKPLVRKIAHELKGYGLKPWLDEEQILGGETIIDVVYKGILQSKTGAFFIGSSGLGHFQENIELHTIIQWFVNQKKNLESFRVIPILLPGVNNIPEQIGYLQILHWIKFDQFNEVSAIDELVRSIRGREL